MSWKPSRANTSSVGSSGSALCDVVDGRIANTSDRIEFEGLSVRGVHRLGHAPVLELGMPADITQIWNFLPAIDVPVVRLERLLRLLGIRLFGEQVVLEG